MPFCLLTMFALGFVELIMFSSKILREPFTLHFTHPIHFKGHFKYYLIFGCIEINMLLELIEPHSQFYGLLIAVQFSGRIFSLIAKS